MKTYLEPKEIAALEKAAANLRDRLLVRLLFHLGCRVSEALAIKVSDIDFDHANRHDTAPQEPGKSILSQMQGSPWQTAPILPGVW